MKHRSTLKQLLIFLTSITEIIANNHQADVLYLDIRKAFDSVPHNELLVKLREAGITGKLWKFFNIYLKGRQQCVAINGIKSSLIDVSSGVPQGSILGPLLFVIYINDVPSIPTFLQSFLFADDSKFLGHITSPLDQKLVQKDLDHLASWSFISRLDFNLTKTFILTFIKNQRAPIKPDYKLNGVSIPTRQTCRDLGVVFSSDLSWTMHYQKISSKVYQVLGLLRRSFASGLPVVCKRKLYTALVLPHLTFCSPVWRPFLVKDIKTLEKIQRRATKYILGSGHSLDYKERLVSLTMLPLMYTFELNDILFFVSCLKNPMHSLPILQLFSFCSSNTRSTMSSKLNVNSFSTLAERNSFACRVPRLWNSLPSIDLSLPIHSIKVLLKKHFWNHFVNHFDPLDSCTFHYLCPCSKCSQVPNSYNFTLLS